jgi:tetratricopeptide (TPR) repeat protein
MDVSPAGSCPSCRKPLVGDAPAGLCPHCILKLALTSATAGIDTDDIQAVDYPKIPGHLLLEKVGEGGCGDVYLAEQIVPICREVAVKVIKPGMDSRQVITRFEAERQALAMMDHPAIASVLDAGTTAAGRPYFVMEYIDGLPITTHCDRQRLGIHERLVLFIGVCQAIQHAHQKGVIHRDIKPSNILVTIRDGQPLPKVIDFGIAKAVGGDSVMDATMHTMLGGSLGTPAYMSPEQAGLGRGEMDTRTDVHGLGVLLYELLTGTLPHAPKGNSPADVEDLRRLIREQDPPKPSERVISAARASELASLRGTDTRRLAADLRGDLDAIVMMAIEKNPDRRYDSAAALARDLQAHLAHQPILARPQGLVGSMVKFTRRHRTAVIISAAFLTIIIAASVVSTVAAIRARQAEKAALIELHKSFAAARFLEWVFRGVDPAMARGGDTTLLRELLDRTTARLESQLKEAPDVEASISRSIGWTYHKLGMDDQALRLLRRAERIYRTLGTDAYNLGTTLNLLTYCMDPADLVATEKTATEAYHFLKAVADDPDVDPGLLKATAMSTPALGRILMRKGDPDAALAILTDWHDFQVRVLGADSHEAATTLDTIGQCELRRTHQPDHQDRAEACFRKSLAIREKNPDDGDELALATIRMRLGELLVARNRLAEAAPLLEQGVREQRRLLGPQHPNLSRPLLALARLKIATGDLDAAEALFIEIRALPIKSRMMETLNFNINLKGLAELFEKRGEPARARAVRALMTK